MESLTIIKYKWETGVYGLKEMSKLVQLKKISEDEFFKITGYSYKGLHEKD